MGKWNTIGRRQIVLALFLVLIVWQIWVCFHSGNSALQIVCWVIWLIAWVVAVINDRRSKTVDEACYSLVFATMAVFGWTKGWGLMLKKDPSSRVLLIVSPCMLIAAFVFAWTAVTIHRNGKRSLRDATIP